MPSHQTKVKVFGRSYERSRAIGSGLFAIAVVLIAVGTKLGGPFGTIVAAIGATLGTTGIVSFLADPVLKDLLAQEIFERVGLRDSVVAAGLTDICPGVQLDTAQLASGSRRIVAVPMDPFTWAREDFGGVLAAVGAAVAEVVIILPSPSPGPARRLLADRLRTDEDELERRLRALSGELLHAWDRSAVVEGATLSILEQDELLSCGMFICDASAVIEVGPALRQSATDRLTLAELFEPGSPYARWAVQQVEDMIAAATPVDARPITAPDALPGRRAAISPDTTERLPRPAAPGAATVAPSEETAARESGAEPTGADDTPSGGDAAAGTESADAE